MASQLPPKGVNIKGVRRPTYNKLLAAGKRGVAREVGGKEFAERRGTHLCSKHQSDSQRLVRIAVQRSDSQDKKNCTTTATLERTPVALINGHMLNVKHANLRVALTAQFASRGEGDAESDDSGPPQCQPLST